MSKLVILQLFCNLQKAPAMYGAAFARRRSGVRIPSAPLQYPLQMSGFTILRLPD